MNKHLLLPILFFSLCLAACSTTGIKTKKISGWNGGRKLKEARTLCLGSIVCDKPGGASSTEREIAALLPLLFLEKKLVFPADQNSAEFVVDVFAMERDYLEHWETKKSIALEVLLYPNYREPSAAIPHDNALPVNTDDYDDEEELYNPAQVLNQYLESLIKNDDAVEKPFRAETPLAAGRVVATGTLGFSSSKNTETLLRKAVRKAANIARKIKREDVEERREAGNKSDK
jgi:hypothetical protein